METPSKIKVIDRDVAVTIEMNANFIAIMQEILNNMIEEYGKENFMKLAKNKQAMYDDVYRNEKSLHDTLSEFEEGNGLR